MSSETQSEGGEDTPSDGDRFVVQYGCENCESDFSRSYPSETIVREHDGSGRIHVINKTCEQLGTVGCDCCSVIYCPTCELTEEVTIADREPLDPVTRIYPMEGDPADWREMYDRECIEAVLPKQGESGVEVTMFAQSEAKHPPMIEVKQTYKDDEMEGETVYFHGEREALNVISALSDLLSDGFVKDPARVDHE